MKDTDKYVKIKCLQGCMYECWFTYDEDPANKKRYNIVYFRCI